MLNREPTLEQIPTLLESCVFIPDDSAYDRKLMEAYMCCVVLATDSRGLLVRLDNDIGVAGAITNSLVKNLPKYGYKIVKE